jgi:hypothetical protein
MPLAAADNAIVTALERHLLDESVLAAAMQRAAERAQRTEDVGTQRDALKKRVDQLSTELERLTGAIVAGGEAATLVQAVRERERLLTAAKADLARLERPGKAAASVAQAHAELRAKLADWRSLLRAHVPQARQMGGS